ncbi:PepSY-like domain-containing protein [Flavisolibacter nicotianae]|uniref:PepSY-like domain-containing protein n=1 Tax=Flavisolibacter nicotianae TaxID=2364882 RepID=UPI0013C45395|nr:PepSY-like domain-containing protein [Flavisolibacter nicotianae]
MKTSLILAVILTSCTMAARAQTVKSNEVPAPVKAAFQKSYANATQVTWEKEKGNYEANWGGKSGEDHSVQYRPSGELIEVIQAIPISQLPKGVSRYVKAHYKGARITEAGRVTDAKGKVSFEAEVNKKDILFDEKGNFLKVED